MTFDSEISSAAFLTTEMTLEQALETAKAFETAAHQFYRQLSRKVRAEIRPLICDLADEEKRHYDLLCDLTRSERINGHLRQRIESPPTAEVFGSYVQIPALPDDPIEEDILAYAASRERIAYEHYGHLAEQTPPGPLKSLFAFLREEEAGHVQSIESREMLLFSVF
jgi:rubrerythrin